MLAVYLVYAKVHQNWQQKRIESCNRADCFDKCTGKKLTIDSAQAPYELSRLCSSTIHHICIMAE